MAEVEETKGLSSEVDPSSTTTKDVVDSSESIEAGAPPGGKKEDGPGSNVNVLIPNTVSGGSDPDGGQGQVQPDNKEEEGSTTTGTGDPKLIEAKNMLVKGKRLLVLRQTPDAVESLELACKLFVELTGTFSPESAEAHFYCGKALLELARTDESIFENKATLPQQEGLDDEDDEDEEDEGEEKASGDDVDEEEDAVVEPDTSGGGDGNAVEAMEITNGASTSEADAANGVTSRVDESIDLSAGSPASELPQLVVQNGTGGSSGSGQEPQPSTSNGHVNGGVDETSTEPTNLELAWEVLEVAKVYYMKTLAEAAKGSDGGFSPETIIELRHRLSDTHALLGEIATESEMYSNGAEEFKVALEQLKLIEEEDQSSEPTTLNRSSAMLHFQLGIAYSFLNNFDAAIQSFQSALDLVSKRLEFLKEKLVPDSEPSKTTEISELEILVPELKEKVQDTIDAKAAAAKVAQEEKNEAEVMARFSPVKNPNPSLPPPTNIGHLVKKRKAPSGGEEDNGSAAEAESNEVQVNNPSSAEVKSPPMKRLFTEADSTGSSGPSGGGTGSKNGHETGEKEGEEMN